MAVKKGFKLTEMGEIPQDWKVATLGKVALILRGASPRPIEDYLTKKHSGYNWIKIGDVNPNAKYITATEEQITNDGAIHSRLVYKGDFLLSNSMSFGRPYILQIDGCIHDGWLVIQNYKTCFDTNFLYYLLCSKCILKQYKEKAAGSGVLNLNKELVASVLVCYPSLKEQSAIASALSDIDYLITSLERLIAKKRLIKQGAMQELLTGKRRLPGFVGEWKIKKIKDFADIQIGRTPSRNIDHFWGKGNVWLSIADLNKKYISDSKENITDIATLNMNIVKQGTLLMSFKLTLGKCAFAACDLYTNEAICAFNNIKENADFIYYALSVIDFSRYGIQAVKGVTLNQNFLTNIEILCPSLEEQSAIAAVLSDMDAEISALEAKLEKTRQIKAGMMNELLTGRIRLL